MKRIHAIILCFFILVSTSCNSKHSKHNYKSSNETISNDVSSTDISNTTETIATFDKTILYFYNETIENEENDAKEAKTREGNLPNIIQVDFENETQENTFIKTYLQERGIYKEAPDGITYYNGNKLAEYYVNPENNTICFLLHAITNSVLDKVYCVTLNLDDMTQKGKLTYCFDKKKDTVYENLYDINGTQAAHIAYQYIPSVLFPLISEYEDMDSYKESIGDVGLMERWVPQGQFFTMRAEEWCMRIII